MKTNLTYMRAFLILLAALVFQSPSAARPRHDQALASALQPFIDQGEIAGAVAVVVDDREILASVAVGKSDIAKGRRMRPDDVFWIASMSKPIAAIAIGMLRDEGKLSFDDEVARYIPEFQSVTCPDGTPLTLRHLLTHTGGIAEKMEREPHLTLSETAEMAATVPLRDTACKKWAYSTLGIDLVGRVVEVAGGMPFERFLSKRLFMPLGMKDTQFWVTSRMTNRYALSYRKGEDGELAPTTIPYLYGTEPTDHSRPPLIGAGLFSTAADIAKIYQMMLDNGMWRGRRILRSETVAELIRKQTGDLKARPGIVWGLGFSIIEDPSQLEANNALHPGTFGHGGAFGTASWADPKTKRIYVLMLQRAGLRDPDNSAFRIAYQVAADTMHR